MSDENKSEFAPKVDVLENFGQVSLKNISGKKKDGSGDYNFDQIVIEQKQWNKTINAFALQEVKLSQDVEAQLVKAIKAKQERAKK